MTETRAKKANKGNNIQKLHGKKALELEIALKMRPLPSELNAQLAMPVKHCTHQSLKAPFITIQVKKTIEMVMFPARKTPIPFNITFTLLFCNI